MTILRDLFGPGTWGTGGNLVAWALCGAIAAVGAYLLRDRLGPALARWWHRHHGEHLRGELAAMEERLAAQADARHEELKAHLTAELARAAPRAVRKTAGTSSGRSRAGT